MEQKTEQSSKTVNKGFTLIELLVVVLIIGILAAIALPQYKMVVGTAKFSTLKHITKSVTESAQRYYLLHNIYPRQVSDLDISFDIINETTGATSLRFTTSEGIRCFIWYENSQNYVACEKEIFGKWVRYYMLRNEGIPGLCITYSTDVDDSANRLCQKETGKNKGKAQCRDSYCQYHY